MFLRRVDRVGLPAYLSLTASRETHCFDTTRRRTALPGQASGPFFNLLALKDDNECWA